jgi:hypothetical protein
MKKIISLLAVTLLIVTSSFSQETNTGPGTSFGIRAGVNFQNINGKDFDGDKLENDMLVGFNAGLNAEIPIAPDFFFQPGILFTTKGAQEKTVILGTTITSRIQLSYLELPLNLVYKPMLGNGHLILGFGPYVAYGIAGKAKIEGGDSSFESDIDFKNETSITDNNYVIRPLDAGANLFFGYEFANRLSFQLNTQLGLINIQPDYSGVDMGDSKMNNTGFGVSLGYRFGG